MLKRVVAIFDARQKVRESPGTLAGDGDLGHLEGTTAWGQRPDVEHAAAGRGGSRCSSESGPAPAGARHDRDGPKRDTRPRRTEKDGYRQRSDPAVSFNFLMSPEFAYDPHPDSSAPAAGQVKRQIRPEGA